MDSEQLAWLIRRHVIEMAYRNHTSHIGSNLSVADILAVLYADVLKYDVQNPGWEERDILVMSKGHASAALYAVLAESGFLPTEELQTHYCDGGRLFGHVSHYLPGIECSTGSLGHGFAMAAGMAFARKKTSRPVRVFAILGDGECNEGSVWETAMFASHAGLGNLTAIIDYNKIQGLDYCDNIVNLSPLAEKWSAFGWHSVEVDGHDHKQLLGAMCGQDTEKPTAIIANTVKGHSVSFMESQVLWHYRYPHDGWEYDEAIEQLCRQMPDGAVDPYKCAKEF